MYKKRGPVVIFVCLFLLLFGSHAGLAAPPPKIGDVLPAIQLPMPEDPARKAYLGLSAGDVFQIPQIKADVVIIEIFSMY